VRYADVPSAREPITHARFDENQFGFGIFEFLAEMSESVTSPLSGCISIGCWMLDVSRFLFPLWQTWGEYRILLQP